jgi:hypothetical protein
MAEEDGVNDFSGKRPATATHQVRTDVELKPAWRLKDPKIERDALAFWKEYDLLPKEASGEERLGQLLAAGYDGERMIAVATAYIAHLDFVNARMAMFRCATAADKRQSRISTVLLSYGRELLEKWSAENPQEDVRGMAMVTQNAGLLSREAPARAQLRSSRMTFVGWTSTGYPIRLTWFEHATVPQRAGKVARTSLPRIN